MLTLIAALLLCASTASAQGRGRNHAAPPPHPPMVHAPPPPRGEAGMQPRRETLERQFRQRSEQVVRERLNLNDDQVARLRSVNANIGAQRNSLLEQERSVRTDLRDELAKGSSADQARVSQLMGQAHDLQGKRFALQQDEQQQLSGFMTPVQVAQYVGLQAQIRQRIREMQQGQNPDQPIPNP